MSDHSTVSSTTESWSQYAKYYDPIKIGSIDGTDTEPHDKAIIRAVNSEYRPNRHVKGRPECTIFVARLSPKTTKDTIKEVFSKFGRLRRFRLVKDIVTGTPKGYAFIEYETERSAEDAYRKANKMYLDGQALFVDFECERLLKGWKPRRLGGGFGGRKESGQLRFGGRDRPFRKPITLEIQERNRLERERRNREYRTEECGNNRHKSFQDREDRHRQSNDRSRKNRYFSRRHSEERIENEENRKSREYRNYHKERDAKFEKNILEEVKDTTKTTDYLENRNGENKETD